MFKNLRNNELIGRLLSVETMERILVGTVILVGGFLLIRIIVVIVRRITAKGLSGQSRMVVDKAITYTGMTILIIVVLSQFGVNLTALLGAAGVLGIAVGVASQKSLGNMVSGIFLLSEKPFEVGDVVRVEDKTGIVQDVDLLSLKIRTFDNQMVRIPNETLISTIVVNITRYPLRRMDFMVSISYGDDLDIVEDVLRKVAADNELVLEEPEPLFLFRDFGSSGIELTFGVWFLKDDYLDVKNSMFRGIYKEIRAADMTIPFQQIVVHEPKISGADPGTPSGTAVSRPERS